MSDDLSLWLYAGKIGRSHGIKGAFYISDRMGPFPTEVKTIAIGHDIASSTPFSIDHHRPKGQQSILFCKEITTINKVEELRGQKIWIHRDSLEINQETEYFWADLMDKKVLDNKGIPIGTIFRVHNYGASDVVFIQSEDGSQIEIPFVAAYFNMNFKVNDTFLHLVVEKDIFNECWN